MITVPKEKCRSVNVKGNCAHLGEKNSQPEDTIFRPS